VNALLIVLLIGGTALLSVAFGVFSAYWVVTKLLEACNPSRPTTRPSPVLVPHQSSVSGD
jgi:hypothetical protein